MDLVVVTFNYRVGPYGFLSSPEIAHNGDLNAGFMDQRKALQWVQDHISKVRLSQAFYIIHPPKILVSSVVTLGMSF